MKKIIPVLILFIAFSAHLQATCNQAISNTQVTCYQGNNGTATLHYLGTGMHYVWSTGDSTDVTITGLQGGAYSVNVYDSTYTLLCTLNTTILSPPIMNPVATVVGIDNFCSGIGGRIYFTGYADYSWFQWSNGVSGLNVWNIDTLSSPGQYTVTITDTLCPANTVTLYPYLPIGQALTATYTGPVLSACLGGSVELTFDIGNSDYAFSYTLTQAQGNSSGTTMGGTQAIVDAGPGPYIFTVHEGNCSADSIIVTGVVDTNGVSITFSNDVTNSTLCQPANGIATINASGGTAPYTYYWDFYGMQGQTITSLGQGEYDVTVTDANGCTATDTIIVMGPDLPYANFTNTNLACNIFDTTIITITGSSLTYVINWGDGITDTAGPAAMHIYTQANQYNVIVTDTTTGCINGFSDNIQSTSVYVYFDGARLPDCATEHTGMIAIGTFGGTPPYSYRWNNGTTTDTISGIASGNYIVTVTDSAGCMTTLRYDLGSNNGEPGFYVYVTTTQANCGNNAQLAANISGGVSPYSYTWNTLPVQTGNTAINLTAGYYTITATDALGCQVVGNAIVPANCTNIINGHIFWDANNNCLPDSGELPVSGAVIEALCNSQIYYADADVDGNYSLDIPDSGTVVVSAYIIGQCQTIALCSTPVITFSSTGDSIINYNIAAVGSSTFNQSLHPGWSPANPGFVKKYWVYCYNNSPTLYTGADTVTFTYDPNLIYQYSDNPQPVNNTATHTLTWILNTPITNWPGIYLDGYFMVPDTLNPTYLLQSQFTLAPLQGDCDPSDNIFTYSNLCMGSQDPNEKTVTPAGSLTDADSVLTYTIYFQNTGTAATNFVIVTDTLSPGLDPATVVNLASSDTYSQFNISGKGILTWTFNPLSLPDSITDPQGSKGFIIFKVKRKPGLTLGTTINNKAYIYFDYNKAVITNTVADTVTEASPNLVPTYTISNISVKAVPNPFTDATLITINGIHTNYSFELLDLTGRTERSLPSLQSNIISLQRNNLANGVYLYRIVVDGTPVAYGKLVVH